MYKRIVLIFIAFVISSCTDWSVKRSASNKLFDTKGFEGSKRRPLYNKKYIDQAKKNIRTNNYDEDYEDEDDEVIAPSSLNRSMYRDMIEEERRKANLKKKNGKRNLSEYDDKYPRLSDANTRSKAPDRTSEEDMKNELQEIKKLLDSTRKDMVKYRCPLEEQANKEKSRQSSAAVKAPSPAPKKTHTISSSDIDDYDDN